MVHMETPMINYVQGDATAPQGDGNKIILHVCNDIGGWGAGFVLALSQRWPEPEAAYRRWYQGRSSNNFELGEVQVVPVEPDIMVANLIGQRDIHPGPDGPPIRYEALEAGLSQLADEAYAADASVHMPRIGCGLAGGDWETVGAIVQRTLVDTGTPVTVYDL